MARQPAEETYKQVKKIVDKGGMTKAAAIKQVAETTKRPPSSIAVTFYRVQQWLLGGRGAAKQAPVRARRPATPVAEKIPTNGAAKGDTRATVLLTELESLLAAQSAEIARLREEAAEFAEIKKLLGS